MTIAELKEAIKDMPDDAEFWETYDGVIVEVLDIWLEDDGTVMVTIADRRD